MRQFVVALLVVLTAGFAERGLAREVRVSDPVYSPAARVRDPSRCVLLDVNWAGNRLVAVGERGIVILSEDGGLTWRQVNVPTGVSLTRVKFITPTCGWALGNAGIVLHTDDGGQTWTRRLDGIHAAHLALKAARENIERSSPDDSAAKEQLHAAELLVTDGPDKPFFDLYFENEQTGFIIGAYGLIFRTENGGKTWAPWMSHIENPKSNHLYAIKKVGSDLFIAGEQGLFLRSTDNGQKFTELRTPYKGTFFTLTARGSGQIVLAGLRGNVFWTTDQGQSFTQGKNPVKASISASTWLPGGVLIFADQEGSFLESRDGGRTLRPLDIPRIPPVAALVASRDSAALVTVGLGGVIRIQLPESVRKASSGGAR
ncbi:MAG: YCF48-related protein [Syntrophobacteraceae bacterium]|nr:YCF48-related protein [Syntrophobacteraceae bacterium]